MLFLKSFLWWPIPHYVFCPSREAAGSLLQEQGMFRVREQGSSSSVVILSGGGGNIPWYIIAVWICPYIEDLSFILCLMTISSKITILGVTANKDFPFNIKTDLILFKHEIQLISCLKAMDDNNSLQGIFYHWLNNVMVWHPHLQSHTWQNLE